ncbi:Probable nitrile hydratase (NHase) (Nitrilase) [Durusdinium trenchii]|uniref:nitrile hydratase n=2 Tax=Durusdinium trenchii TaxID=1381693 RepID=A0ABP0JWR6_9DINO
MVLPIGPHDLGTLPAIPSTGSLPLKGDRQHAFWERQVHATAMLLVAKGHLKVDEVRRGIEYLESETYAKASYYEKWASSICSALLEHQLLSNAELGVELGADDSEAKPRFAVGDVVRVRESGHACRWRRPHLRTPGFVHGVCGTVERSLGSFANPEQLAFGGQAWTKCPLYLVRFDAKSIQDFDAGEVGEDQVTVEIYQSWLENADLQELEQQRKKRRETAKASDGHPDCKRAKTDQSDHGHNHDHVHEERSVVEQRAVDEELPCPAIARALVAAVQKKGIVGADELRQSIERLDEGDRNRGAAGRKVVARAWVDQQFKVRLMADANSACAELGLNAVNPTAPTQLVVFEQTPKVHHLIVCTLCSCYPLPLLGLSPDWYKSREYRSRAVREPRKVLKEFGTELPQEVQVVVHDSTADCRYMILPQRPRGTEDWSEEKLQEIITRDSMIGVTVLPEAV